MQSIEARDAEPTDTEAAKSDSPKSSLTSTSLGRDVSQNESDPGKVPGFSSIDSPPDSTPKEGHKASQESNDVWAAAIEAISSKDLECLSRANTEHLSHRQIVSDILETATEKKRDCSKKRWKVKIKDRTIVLRDVLEKTTMWISKVIMLKSRESLLSQEFTKLQSLIEELAQPVNRISDEVEAIRDDLNTEKRSKVLMAISSIPSRSHHKAARKGRLQGSGKWLLKKPAFVDWRQQSVSSVIWLHGIPGSGKTKLTSLVVDELESIVEQYKEALSGFADFEDQEWTSDESFSVLLKLMEIYPSITIVLDALDEVNQEDRQELLDILSKLLQESSGLLKIFISSRDNYDISHHLSGSPNVYIEASDNAGDISSRDNYDISHHLSGSPNVYIEASDNAGDISSRDNYDISHHLSGSPNVYIEASDNAGDISSRDNYDISHHLSGSPNVYIEASDNAGDISSRDNYDISHHLSGSPNVYIEASDNAGDIEGFIQSELQSARLLNGRLSDDLRALIRKKLSEGAHGMFRWVALQMQVLRPLKVAADIEARLGDLPATLEESYWEIYQQIQSCGDHAARLASFTFRWLLFAQKSIRPDGLAAIATSYFSEGRSNHVYDAVNILDVCANLVTERGNMVAMAHLSVREFFEGISKRGVKDFAPEISHACLADACVYHLIRSTPELEKHFTASNVAEFTNTILIERDDIDYPSHNWHHHVLLSKDHRNTPGSRRILQLFLFENDHFTKMFNIWCMTLQAYARQWDSDFNPESYAFTRKASLFITSKRVRYSAGQRILTIIIDHLDSSMNSTAATQESLLLGAVINQSPHLVKLLLDRKVGLKGLSKALYLATLKEGIETRDILLQHGAKSDENAAVIRALILGAPQTAINLIDAKYDIEGRYLDKARTALHYAVEKGFSNVVKCLLERNVAVNIYDRDRKTPLHIAAGKGETECVKLLLSHGADFLLEDRDGHDALGLAEIKDHQPTAILIRNEMQQLMEKLQKGKSSRRDISATN
ncbi:ankyrin repeat-containing protein [Colletotrichum kahawae]|uniref:Ankyrin repeat-containing protein n=1 Tax=Colletotrichum kahawae TaxID=34407 RepID=A0AAD9YKC6_COLKA|nr:ankyrin repeat-containing protein [Colletotrichum kahawae]